MLIRLPKTGSQRSVVTTHPAVYGVAPAPNEFDVKRLNWFPPVVVSPPAPPVGGNWLRESSVSVTCWLSQLMTRCSTDKLDKTG